jgi:hypothetical protein
MYWPHQYYKCWTRLALTRTLDEGRHVAGYSPCIAGRHLKTLLDNVGRFVRDEPLLNVAGKEKWY